MANPFEQFRPQAAAAAPNPFEQFRPHAPAAPAAPNPFEQFRSAAAAPAARPAEVVQAEYDQKPWYGQMGQAADDVVRLLANGMTFGYADKLAGAMGSEGVDAERMKSQGAQTRAGSAGTAAELTGAIAVPLGAAKAGLTVAGRAGTAAMEGAKGLAARSGLMAAEGAGYGALTASGHDQDIAAGAGYGALAGGAGNVVGEGLAAGVDKVAGLFNKKPAIPTPEQARATAQTAYQAADDAGVVFNAQGLQRLRDEVQNDLFDFGYHPELQPRVGAVWRELEKLAQGNVSLKGVDQLRKIANNARISDNDSERKLAGRVISRIDEFVGNAAPGEVLAGDASAGAAALKQARDMWGRTRKAEEVMEAAKEARRRADATGTGGNVDNATRQNMRSVLESTPNFTADEQAALETAIRGTPWQNTLRMLGKFAPQNTLNASVAAGYGGSISPALAFLPAAAQGAKMAADHMTQNRVQDVIDVIMAGGTKAAAQAPPNVVQKATADYTDPVIRAVMAWGANRGGGEGR